jgi:hypothetical protein
VPRGGPSKNAPNTRHEQPSRKGNASKPSNFLQGPNAWNWPDDQSLSMFDSSHRQAGFWAIDTVNPNCWKSGAAYMEGSAADIIFTQELKVPDGHLRDQAEQTARNAKWSLAIEPCHVSPLGGHSAGTSVAVRSFIGMSKPLVVKESEHLHPTGHFCMRRVAAMGEGGVDCGSPYLYSMVGKGGITAQCNLDMLDSMAFTILGLVGPWIIGGDWNCTPQDLAATGWLQKVGGTIHAPTAPHVMTAYTTSSLLRLASPAEYRVPTKSETPAVPPTPPPG